MIYAPEGVTVEEVTAQQQCCKVVFLTAVFDGEGASRNDVLKAPGWGEEA